MLSLTYGRQLGTNCRNLPQVHTLVRMMNLACSIVCPSVLLLGEVVMEPKEVVPYFGTEDKPECDMLYNVTTMCTIWHTLATRDVRLLKHQFDQLENLPANCLFQNYLRCHDDIGWGLDYGFLGWFGIKEAPHKKYLNDWFTGNGREARQEESSIMTQKSAGCKTVRNDSFALRHRVCTMRTMKRRLDGDRSRSDAACADADSQGNSGPLQR